MISTQEKKVNIFFYLLSLLLYKRNVCTFHFVQIINKLSKNLVIPVTLQQKSLIIINICRK